MNVKINTQVVSYTYDTWGKLLSTTGSLAGTVGLKNPYRYRGYRDDTETGYYYCQSRYYNPEWGRWLNADDPEAMKNMIEIAISDPANHKDTLLLMGNLFAYCANNPVNNSDPSGYWLPAWLKNTIKTIVHTFAEDWRDNTIINIISLFGGALGALKAVKEIGTLKTVVSGSYTIASKGGFWAKVGAVFSNAFKELIGTATVGRIGEWLGTAGKFIDIEGTFDSTPVGAFIDNLITIAENKLLAIVDSL